VRFRRVVPAIVAPAIVLAGLAGVAAFQSGPAQAAAAAGLPVASVYQVVADTAHGHLFISQGPDAGTDAPIVVTNLSGTPITTIGDGARGLALSANDETLYAATGDTVSAFSTTTLKETASYPTPGTAWQVALQSGRLWVSYQDEDAGEIGAIDLANGSDSWNAVPGQWIDWPPDIALDPGTGVLVTSSVGTSEPVTATYNASDSSAVTLIASVTPRGCGNPNELSILPGGKTFLCDGIPYSTATLSSENSSGGFYGGVTAVAPDGAIAVGDVSDDGSIMAYPAGATTPTASYYQFGGLSVPAAPAIASFPVDFAWSGDGRQLFTIVESQATTYSAVFTELTLYPFEKVPADLTLASSATSLGYGGSATITAHLGFTYANRAFSVYETIAGQPRQLLWSGANDPSGTVTIRSSLTRNATFTAVFTGDARYQPTTVTLDIKVGAKVAAALSGYYKSAEVSGLEYRLYHHTATLRDAVTITPAKHDECAQLQVQEYSEGAWRTGTTTRCGTLNKASKVTIPLKLTEIGRFRVRANFVRAKTDAANVSTTGSWLYYEVTK
jgi:hypothetical protein